MIIWLCLLVPAIAVVIMAVFFKRSMAWWEYLLMFGVPLLAIIIAKVTVEVSATTDREFWNSYLVSAQYNEEWSTWHTETCSRQVCNTVCTGSGSNRSCTQHCRTVYYDCSHCDRHPAFWEATDNLGKTYSIHQAMFEELCRRWNKRDFVDMNRHIDHHLFCGKDGDAYRTVYDNVFEHTQPVCVVHLYENRVQASRSVFNFEKVTEKDIKEYGLIGYRYDSDVFLYNPIMGTSDPLASQRLSWWNAHLGAPMKVHMIILVFTDQPRLAGDLQQAYWCGGNKNEFVLCIGVDKDKRVQWTKVFSWTEVDRLKLDVERSVYMMHAASDSTAKPLNLTAVVDTMATMVKGSFVKKSFKDFKYLTVEPSGTVLLVTFLVTIGIATGLGVFCVLNRFESDGTRPEKEQRWTSRSM